MGDLLPSLKDEAVLESGRDDRKYAHNLLIRAFVYESIGSAAVEIKATNNRSAAPYAALGQFSIRCEVSAVNRFGADLSAWLNRPEKSLLWIVSG